MGFFPKNALTYIRDPSLFSMSLRQRDKALEFKKKKCGKFIFLSGWLNKNLML